MNTGMDDEKYMQRCLDLARMGQGNTGINPMVGAIIVYNGKIIGEGYHKKFGDRHAEANAINSIKDKSVLEKSTLYVNLEPCSHSGKTPPCSELIIRYNIPRLVISTIDPNSIVSGKGVAQLKSNSVKVKVGILEKEAVKLNKRFFTYYGKNRPYITLKWAQTKDNYIDKDSEKKKAGKLNWISSHISRILVHKWRSEEQSIMVGTTTALLDNPSLNTRLWNGNNPVRLVLDRNLKLPQNLKIFDGAIKTLVFTEKKAVSGNNIEFINVNYNDQLLEEILEILFQRGIQSILVEGGKMLIESFIKKDLWDEARVIIGNKDFHSGIPAPVIQKEHDRQIILDYDKILFFFNNFVYENNYII